MIRRGILKMKMEFKQRKKNRLVSYDYSSNGAYFVTICAKDRKNLFWAVGASSARPNEIALSDIGLIVERAIQSIPIHYPQVSVDHYVIMPNHVHLLLQIYEDERRAMLAPTVSRVIQQMKGYVSKRVGTGIWQKSFYDEIARNEQDYLAYWNYIEGNPLKWAEDEYYFEE